MAVRLQANQIQNLQQIDAAVTGPEGANRLITVTGQTTNIGFGLFSQGPFTQANQTFTVLVGPGLTRSQFFRAICCVAVAQTSQRVQVVPGDCSCGITGSDADWDDELGQVELRVEVSLNVTGNGNSVFLNSFSFQVTILAAAA
jgi:hypothetical protein